MSTTSYSIPADVTPLVNITFTDSSKPTITQVREYIARADDFINTFTGGNWITNSAVDEYYDGDGRGVIVLKHRPVLAVTKVEWWNGNEWCLGVQGKNTDHTADEYYEIYADKGLIRWYRLRALGMHMFRVNYTHGYASIPTGVKALSATLAAINVLCFLSGVAVNNWILGDTQVKYPDKGKYATQIAMLDRDREALLWEVGTKSMLSGTG
jgi:hypothetical protein